MTPPRYRLCLLLLVSVEVTLTWLHPSADAPLDYSRDLSLSVDGYWYLAEAKAWTRGDEARVNRGYRKPLVSVPTYLAYRLAGVSLASSRALNSAASVGTLLLLAFLIRRRHGEASALLGAFLLAVDPAWHVYVRSPVIYPWVSFWILASIAMAAGEGALRWWAGLAFMALGAVFLKSIVLLAAPAILLDGFLRIRWKRDRRLGLVPLALALAAMLTFQLAQPLVSDFWHRVAYYMSGGETAWWAQPWRFEERCQFFSAFPLIFLLAAVSALASIAFARPEGHGGRSMERMLHTVLWIGLGTFACARYSPLRYLLGLFPVLVYLSVSGLAVIRHRSRLQRLAPRALRGGLAVTCGVVLAVFSLRQYALALSVSPLPAVDLALAGSLLAVIGAVIVSRTSGSPGHLAPVWVASLALVISVPRWTPILTSPQYTLQRAGEQIACMLPPKARVVGPFAHALSVENGLRVEQISQLRFGGSALRDEVARRGWTHLVMDRPQDPTVLLAFERDGVSLEPVDAFHVRGVEVQVYRIRGVSLARSPFEEARDLLRHDMVQDAESAFAEVIETSPQCAAAWEGMGICRLSRGEPAEAREFFLEALRRDPGRVSTHLLLMDLYARNGYRREALEHLHAVRSMDRNNAELGRRLEEMESRLAATSK